MFSFLIKKLFFWFSKRQTAEEKSTKQNLLPETLSRVLRENIVNIQNITGNSSDVVVREFTFGGSGLNAAIIFIDGLADVKIINKNILEPLIGNSGTLEFANGGLKDRLQYIEKSILAVSDVRRTVSLTETIDNFLSGDVALLIDGLGQALSISCKGWEKRNISEPMNESVVRGPKEAFTENLRTATSLLRRKIKNPDLTFESTVLGKKTKTNICICYIRGIVHPELLETVKKRVDAINIDSILESGYIEQYIEDAPGSIFATVGYTERPDSVAAKLLEGRVAIIVDGTPFVLTVPYLFIESFQSAEDYYSRPYFSSLLRNIRLLAYAIAVLSPAIYVAITTYHQELIPTNLLFTMASAREGIPFPAFVEAFLMGIAFEIMREAGIRLPRPVGQSLSIVGALVIGDAAVSAGLVGAPVVIVVGLTALSGFVVPGLADSAAILRIILIILAGALGGFGIAMGLLGLLVHLASLESFGYPFLAPTVPFDLVGDSQDAMIRAPLWLMLRRPKAMALDKKRRSLVIPPAGDSDRDE